MRFIQQTLAFVLAGSILVAADVRPVDQLDVSHDGTCGSGVTCTGSSFGGCCSADGKCGSTPDYCGKGCQNPFGWCQKTEGTISPDGTCGGSNGYTCKGSKYGNCCSRYEYCGSTSEYCAADNCLSSFGECKFSKPASSAAPDVSSVPSPYSDSRNTTHSDGKPIVPRESGSDCSCPKANGTVYKTECGAEFEIECGVDHEGGDIWLHEKGGNGFFTESLQKCIDACAKFPKCIDVSWIDQHRPGGACYMKNRVGKKTYAAHVFGARQVKQCDKGCPTVTPDVHAPPYTRPYIPVSQPSTKSASGKPSQSPQPSAPQDGAVGHPHQPGVHTSDSYYTSVGGSDEASKTSYVYPTGSIPVVSGTSKIISKDAIPTNGPEYSSGVSITTITTITPTTIASSADPTASSLASASASASACPHTFHRRSPEPKNTVFKREEIDPDCVPCDGQGGSLPFCGADHTVDNYKFTPKTCRTVYFNLDITNQTMSPDGHERIVLAINGQMPGPLMEANWGDTVVVTVNNMLHDNGTSIHFHGIRQLHNSEHDGVPAITQCPIAPGDSFTYKWVATNYGTSWYHSHYAIQAWEGVVGPMIIHGPTSASWDVDAGTVMLQDWSHRTVDSLYDMAQDAVDGGPRVMDNGLINGMNTFGVEGAANQTGQRFELGTKFEPGKTYLIRIINAAIQATFKFYIDDHELEVINMDFTNIVPYKTNIVNIQIGQRYMLLVKAKAKPGNYWMRADSQRACSGNIQSTDIKGIIRYADAPEPSLVPTSTAYEYVGECIDEPLASLVPTAKLDAFKDDESFTGDVTVAPNSENLFKWYLSGTSFYSKYEDPTLVRVLANATAPTYSGNLILDLPKMGEWIYIIVQSAIPLNHPIHLHGHDFLILGAGPGKYTNQPLNLKNPPRRDTANMPAAGYLVIAFETDNPGAWLMHCHIGWHTSMGFALQILEGKDMVKDTVKDECALYGTCAKWNKWVEQRGFKQHDSGV